MVIELQHVKRNFIVGDEVVHALRGVSFSIPEAKIVQSYGGRVEFVDLVAGRSTTNVIEKIRKEMEGNRG